MSGWDPPRGGGLSKKPGGEISFYDTDVFWEASQQAVGRLGFLQNCLILVVSGERRQKTGGQKRVVEVHRKQNCEGWQKRGGEGDRSVVGEGVIVHFFWGGGGGRRRGEAGTPPPRPSDTLHPSPPILRCHKCPPYPQTPSIPPVPPLLPLRETPPSNYDRNPSPQPKHPFHPYLSYIIPLNQPRSNPSPHAIALSLGTSWSYGKMVYRRDTERERHTSPTP